MNKNNVLMADGRKISISSISLGDRVISGDRGCSTVVNINRSREDTHFEVKVFNHGSIKVTTSDVFMTNHGFKSVKELSFDDEILMDRFWSGEENDYEKIESISHINKEIDVYWLELTEPQIFSVNGYMVGCYTNMMKHKRECDKKNV